MIVNLLTTAFIYSTTIPESSASADASVDIKVTIPDALSITSSKSSINLNPEPNSTVFSDSTDISVSTSNQTGYTLTVSSTTEETSLTNPNFFIPTLTAETTLVTFPVNYWGYSLDNASYLGLPPFSTPATIKITDTPASSDTTNVAFGTKIDMDTPAGIYKNTILFTAIPNYVPKNPFNDISTMQEMESSICDYATIGDSGTLTDTRDNKTYTVKKLSDNKCWMTQNLALAGSRTLTSEYSDVTSNFTLPAVDAGTWCTDNDATCNNKALHRTNPDNSSYGAYYNRYAATAGTGTYEKNSGSAPSPICPKGWKLPTNLENDALKNAVGSYANVILTSGGNPVLVTSGAYNGSSFYNVSSFGYWWSSVASDNRYAYILYIRNTSTDFLTGDYLKYNGISVRCIAK